MKRHALLMAASAAALALCAPDAGAGSGAAPEPESKDPLPDPGVNAVGLDPKADPNPPKSAREAEKAGKRTYMVWAQPGHDTLSIGQLIAVPPKEAEALRKAGRARFASEAEVKAGGKSALVLEGI